MLVGVEQPAKAIAATTPSHERIKSSPRGLSDCGSHGAPLFQVREILAILRFGVLPATSRVVRIRKATLFWEPGLGFLDYTDRQRRAAGSGRASFVGRLALWRPRQAAYRRTHASCNPCPRYSPRPAGFRSYSQLSYREDLQSPERQACRQKIEPTSRQ